MSTNIIAVNHPVKWNFMDYLTVYFIDGMGFLFVGILAKKMIDDENTREDFFYGIVGVGLLMTGFSLWGIPPSPPVTQMK